MRLTAAPDVVFVAAAVDVAAATASWSRTIWLILLEVLCFATANFTFVLEYNFKTINK